MKEQFGRSVSSQLGHYPVWDLGAQVKPGDYGIVDGHCFTKVGDSVEEYQVTIQCTSSAPAFWEYTSKGTTVIGGDVQGKIATDIKTKIELHFTRSNSLYIRAADSRVVSITNIDEVARQLHNHPGRWDHSRFLVTCVRRASSFVLLMNTSENSSITLRADLGILSKIQGGHFSPNMQVEVSGDAGLKYLANNVDVYVDLVRISRFGGRAGLAAMPGVGNVKSYEVIDPRV